MKKERTLWITRTAIFIALLVALQAITAALGNTLITGSIVNLMLIVSVMACGVWSGACVALLSPVMAKLIGIGPLWSLIPFILLGNITLVLLWHFIGDRSIRGKRYPAYLAALITAAVAKFFVLYVGIVKISVPFFLAVPPAQATVISHMFSVPQLITALAGGAMAVALLPRLKRAIAAGKGKMD